MQPPLVCGTSSQTKPAANPDSVKIEEGSQNPSKVCAVTSNDTSGNRSHCDDAVNTCVKKIENEDESEYDKIEDIEQQFEQEGKKKSRPRVNLIHRFKFMLESKLPE